MKRIVLILGLLFSFSYARAENDPYDNPSSSYTEVPTLGPVVFSTGATKWIALLISSPAPNSYVALFRSTSPFVTPNLATQTLVDTSYQSANTNPMPIDLFGVVNTSYTLISKVGTAKVTYFFKMVGPSSTTLNAGMIQSPPGLKVIPDPQ